ncbi:MAG TPA: TPM domain-containing protein, partial [bacterium]|nr:TPM domain-containing protein [bacterium]
MKSVFLFLSLLIGLAPGAWAARWPDPVGAVNDFAHVIPLDQAQNLESYLDDFQNKTGSAIVVVTIASADGDVDGAAVSLFKAWGIGQKGKDNGVLILAAIKDRRARIEVGYGLEGVITDGQAGDILRQQVYPYFKQQQYGEGLGNASHALAQLIAPDASGQSQDQNQGAEGSGGVNWVKIVLFIIL